MRSAVSQERILAHIDISLCRRTAQELSAGMAFKKENDVSIYSAGDRVSQSQYGLGTVMIVNEYHTVINFDEHGSRTFATSLVHLERSATAAPLKPAKPRRRSVKRDQ